MALGLALAGIGGFAIAAEAATAATVELTPKRTQHGTLVYRLADVPATTVRRGYLHRGRRRCPVATRLLRRAARSGVLRVTATRQRRHDLRRCHARRGRPRLVIVTRSGSPAGVRLFAVDPPPVRGPAGPQGPIGDPAREPSPRPIPPSDTGPTIPDVGPTITEEPAPGRIAYYVNPDTGDDSASGTSPAEAWRSLGRASEAPLAPGDRLRLARGSTLSGTLEVARDGTEQDPIVVAAYGEGALPRLRGGCVVLSGSHLTVTGIHADGCDWAGIAVRGDHARVERNRTTNNVAGVHVHEGASRSVVRGNAIHDNDRMSVLTAGGGDDSGAFGVLLQGEGSEVAYNSITGSDAFSYDYGRDGAAVEVYGALDSHVHHNLAVDNDAFAELGHSRSIGNTFAYNVVRSSLTQSIFVVTRGADDSYGPVRETYLVNNTVRLTGALSQGFVCHGGCDGGILKLRNNIIVAVLKAGYADGPLDEDSDLFSGGIVQFAIGAASVVADPQFVDPMSGDLRLGAASPGIDRGVASGYGADFDGSPVPQDGDGDGAADTDLGAFERPARPQP